MEFNSLLFPAPQVTYDPQELTDEVVYIPKYSQFSKVFRRDLLAMGTQSDD